MNIDFLKQLLVTPSPAGFEVLGTTLFRNYLNESAASIEKDILGNAIAYRNGSHDSNIPTIMLEAHIDEIAMQVLFIDDRGYIYVRRDGGIDIQCVPGSQVTIYTRSGKEISGIIGKKPIHLMDSEARGKTVELDKLWIDTGLTLDYLKAEITMGDPVVLNANMMMLGDNCITSKGLDDKVGVYAIAEAFKHLACHESPYNVCAAAFVQEELGNRGAFPGTNSVNPDYAICVDVDFATDVPDCPPQKYGDVKLGGGVVIQRNADSDIDFVERAICVAEEKGIPFQVSARKSSTGGTDSCKVQLSGTGVKTLGLGIPCRYMHTPVEMCNLKDIEATIHLMTELCAYRF